MSRLKFSTLALELCVFLVLLLLIMVITGPGILWTSFGMMIILVGLGVTWTMDSKKNITSTIKLSMVFFLPLSLGISGVSYTFNNQTFNSIPVLLVLVFLLLPMVGVVLLYSLTEEGVVKTNFQFSSFFIVIFSLAGSASSGIGEFISDLYFGTVFLENNTVFMHNLIILSTGSVLTGLLFIFILTWKDSKLFRSLELDNSTYIYKTKKELKDLFRSELIEKKFESAVLISRSFQMMIALLTIYAFYQQDMRWFYSGIISLILTASPFIFKKKTGLPFPPILSLWISIAFFFHILGGVMGYYDDIWWWDILTHAFSASILTFLAFVVLWAFQSSSELIDIPLNFIPVILVLFILSISVPWEIYEFLADNFLGTEMQYGLSDTVNDMILNVLGASVSGILGIFLFRE